MDRSIGDLLRTAEGQLPRGGSDLTLGTTTLLHETYLNVARREVLEFPSRGKFLAYAGRAMRGLMLDYARNRSTKKRGGEFRLTAVDGDQVAAATADSVESLERLASALEELGQANAGLAQLVDLHFFCGFSFEELAELRDVSVRTVHRDWRKARLILHHTIQNA